VWGRGRTLEPSTGAWVVEDKDVFEPRYAYANASPTLLVDPSGQSASEYVLYLYGRTNIFVFTFSTLAAAEEAQLFYIANGLRAFIILQGGRE